MEEKDRDPIGEFLGRNLPHVREPDPGRSEPRWRPSATKIALWSIGAALVATAAVVAVRGTDGPQEPRQPAARTDVPSPERQVAGRVVLVTGDVSVLREGGRIPPAVGDEILCGDTIESGRDASFGLGHADGHTLVILGEARLSVRESRAGELRVALERGVLAARVLGSGGHEAALRIEGLNAEVVGREGLFTVEATEGRLERTAVTEGEVEVLSRESRKDVFISRDSALDMRTWTAGVGEAHGEAVEVITDLVGIEAPVEEPTAASPEEPDGHASTSSKGPSAEDRIEEALQAGDPDLVMQILDTEGRDLAGAGYMMMAADAYAQAGEWTKAAGVFEKAAAALGGKKAERALIKAAEIQLRKLVDAEEAARILDGYFARFPEGAYLDEALYLAGTVQARLAAYEKARQHLERYLELYPKGPQALKTHLALAKILATRLSDCKGAMVHVDAVLERTTTPAVESELKKVAALCGKKEVSP